MAAVGSARGRPRRPSKAALLVSSAAFSVMLTGPVRAADTWSDAYRGTLGPYRIGVDLDVQNKTEFAGGHYFYADRSQDIELTGSVDGSELILTEKGGGIFRLHFVDRGRSGPDLTFYTSTGLVGTWTRGNVSYPVALDLDFAVPKSDRSRYAAVTRAPAGAFEAMVRRFVRGVAAGDRAEAASAVHFPLRVNRSGSKAIVIAGRSQLFMRWAEIFPPPYVAKIGTVLTHDLFVRYDQAMVGDGEAWFDAGGAVSVNPIIRR